MKDCVFQGLERKRETFLIEEERSSQLGSRTASLARMTPHMSERDQPEMQITLTRRRP